MVDACNLSLFFDEPGILGLYNKLFSFLITDKISIVGGGDENLIKLCAGSSVWR